MVREDQKDDQRLVAYVVLHQEDRTEVKDLRRFMAERLPSYMLPGSMQTIDHMPLTENGKLNKQALPAPDFAVNLTDRGPRTPKEEVLCDLFMDILNLRHVGIDDGFFDLGAIPCLP
ncbi:hypothetical protein MUN89_11445 [Halobacillus salinarum]|uniref:AMP-binding enzyme C-terminal domain-containing protein n=1 Tax=Halobacillus salinarum TaxID=2932257 RepID=A0ABY4ERB9_9BACI|nr:hypothetical protein MUN89_11445 [Halobacillus salinarum]